MEDILKFRILNKLKSTYRANSVGERKESSAEHTWSSLMLADYFMSRMKHNLDKVKVYELLMYHDVVEIEAGDTALDPNNEPNNKAEKEILAAKKLKKGLPTPINEKFWKYFNEFEEQQTQEAKFAKAIDSCGAIVHGLAFKNDWKGWSKEFLLSKKANYFEEFPELNESFHKLINYFKEEGYFEK